MNSRECALKILEEIENKGAYANIALAKFLKNTPHIEERERRFITELVYGTVKMGDSLIWSVRQYSKLRWKKIHPVIALLLRMSAYQIYGMDKVPAAAICNEAVKLAKKYGHTGTVKFVNGILRNMTREPQKGDFRLLPENSASNIALKYYHPEWLVKKFISAYGRENALKLCQFDNEKAPLSLRCNTEKLSLLELKKILAEEAVDFQVSTICPTEGIICAEHGALSTWSVLEEGKAFIQDESSMLVAHVVNPQPNSFVLDFCSAPGGKATHLAALLAGTGRVLANDIHPHKEKLIQDNIRRLGLKNIETHIADGVVLAKEYYGKVDCALVDAPCSGLGVLRRKADARWRKNTEELAKLPPLQLALLRAAGQTVRPGGTLVYSTCTILAEENQMVVDEFLRLNPDFKLVDFQPDMAGKLSNSFLKTGMLLLLPWQTGTDGFFIAKMQRKDKN